MKLLEKVPVAGEVIKLLIMACWSAAEAVVDCAGLAEGGKVPLIKSKSSWNLSMDDLQDIAKGGKRAADSAASGTGSILRGEKGAVRPRIRSEGRRPGSDPPPDGGGALPHGGDCPELRRDGHA